jgi:hypothetical protein
MQLTDAAASYYAALQGDHWAMQLAVAIADRRAQRLSQRLIERTADRGGDARAKRLSHGLRESGTWEWTGCSLIPTAEDTIEKGPGWNVDFTPPIPTARTAWVSITISGLPRRST